MTFNTIKCVQNGISNEIFFRVGYMGYPETEITKIKSVQLGIKKQCDIL